METLRCVMEAWMALGLLFVLAMIIGDALRSRNTGYPSLTSPENPVMTPGERYGSTVQCRSFGPGMD
jgi:hypothetical protein